jgi:hypothetical protein
VYIGRINTIDFSRQTDFPPLISTTDLAHWARLNAQEVAVSLSTQLCVTTEQPSHQHHHPINVPTAGAQAFLMDYTYGERAITHHAGHNPPRGPRIVSANDCKCSRDQWFNVPNYLTIIYNTRFTIFLLYTEYCVTCKVAHTT